MESTQKVYIGFFFTFTDKGMDYKILNANINTYWIVFLVYFQNYNRGDYLNYVDSTIVVYWLGVNTSHVEKKHKISLDSSGGEIDNGLLETIDIK